MYLKIYIYIIYKYLLGSISLLSNDITILKCRIISHGSLIARLLSLPRFRCRTHPAAGANIDSSMTKQCERQISAKN